MKHTVYLDGLALWSPLWADWAQARAALRDESSAYSAYSASSTAQTAAARPAPSLLAANERRRAPDSVLMALEVATQATAASGHDRAALASVFASTHGDLAITDALCRTLASNPLLLSPTRFHHSVHNAASGYWAIGTGSHAPSTALSGGVHTFASAWVEAACQCCFSARPVLLVLYDTEACGPLVSVNSSRGLLAMAWVLSPKAGPASRWAVDGCLQEQAVPTPAAHSAAAQALGANASAAALPLMEALSREQATTLSWPLSATLALQLQLRLQPQNLTPPRAYPAAA